MTWYPLDVDGDPEALLATAKLIGDYRRALSDAQRTQSKQTTLPASTLTGRIANEFTTFATSKRNEIAGWIDMARGVSVAMRQLAWDLQAAQRVEDRIRNLIRGNRYILPGSGGFTYQPPASDEIPSNLSPSVNYDPAGYQDLQNAKKAIVKWGALQWDLYNARKAYHDSVSSAITDGGIDTEKAGVELPKAPTSPPLAPGPNDPDPGKPRQYHPADPPHQHNGGDRSPGPTPSNTPPPATPSPSPTPSPTGSGGSGDGGSESPSPSAPVGGGHGSGHDQAGHGGHHGRGGDHEKGQWKGDKDHDGIKDREERHQLHDAIKELEKSRDEQLQQIDEQLKTAHGALADSRETLAEQQHLLESAQKVEPYQPFPGHTPPEGAMTAEQKEAYVSALQAQIDGTQQSISDQQDAIAQLHDAKGEVRDGFHDQVKQMRGEVPGAGHGGHHGAQAHLVTAPIAEKEFRPADQQEWAFQPAGQDVIFEPAADLAPAADAPAPAEAATESTADPTADADSHRRRIEERLG